MVDSMPLEKLEHFRICAGTLGPDMHFEGLLNGLSVAGRLCGCPTAFQNRYSRKSTRGCQEVSSVH